MNPLRPSLQRRIALTLLATFVVGYFVLTYAWDFFGEAFLGGYACFHNTPVGGETCAGSFPRVAIVFVLAFLALCLAGVLWGAWKAAGGLTLPLRTAADAVRRVGPQNPGQRIAMTGGNDDLKQLADALDMALDRIVAGYEGQRRFAANASHELRTPLAVQRVLAEVAMDDPAASQDLRKLGSLLLRTNERSEKLIEGLLVLAESDRGLPAKIPVRLDELAGSVLDEYQGMAVKHGVTLRGTLAERVVPGDSVLLERLLSNLVANAIAYNVPDGRVEVTVSAEPAITVRNSGQHVPQESVPALFEPFRRLTADRTAQSGGTGLGLAIVRSITTAHNGTVRAYAHPDGGLTVEVTLPPAPQALHPAHPSPHPLPLPPPLARRPRPCPRPLTAARRPRPCPRPLTAARCPAGHVRGSLPGLHGQPIVLALIFVARTPIQSFAANHFQRKDDSGTDPAGTGTAAGRSAE
jgi:signal transduction histidine kinase